jgi:hypothetical protein
MIKLLLFSILVMSLVTPVYPNSAKIYVWRNDSGELVFSDSPKAGAEELMTSDANVIQSKTRVNTKVLDIKPQKISITYEISISNPEDQATIRDNTGSVYISANIKPAFKKGLKVQLVLDDKPYDKPQTLAIFALKNIDRGEHSIKMLLINETGKIIASSKTVIFYMHRTLTN